MDCHLPPPHQKSTQLERIVPDGRSGCPKSSRPQAAKSQTYTITPTHGSFPEGERSRGSETPGPPLPRGRGISLLVVPPPTPPQKSREKDSVRETAVSAHSRAVEDVEKESPYLAKKPFLGAALPRVPGAQPRAPVATRLLHLQLSSPAPARLRVPPRAPPTGAGTRTLAPRPHGRWATCALSAACAALALAPVVAKGSVSLAGVLMCLFVLLPREPARGWAPCFSTSTLSPLV
jgi:hypothetical protein